MDVAADILKSGKYKDICMNVAGCNYDDLYQEFALAILEYPKEKLISIYNKGYINWFCIRVISNLYNSKTSQYHYKYRRVYQSIHFTDNITHAVDLEQTDKYQRERVYKQLEKQIDKAHIYPKTLLTMYIQHGSYNKVATLTGLTRKEVTDTVKSFIKELKQCISY